MRLGKEERSNKVEKCAICGCVVNHSGEYAKPTIKGRSHATKHHYIAKRFFRHSTTNKPIFSTSPWKVQPDWGTFCYECHEELLHNPVFLPEDVKKFAELVNLTNLNERDKTASKRKLSNRIVLLHEVIETGIKSLLSKKRSLKL